MPREADGLGRRGYTEEGYYIYKITKLEELNFIVM
jgi:hypothetical protein